MCVHALVPTLVLLCNVPGCLLKYLCVCGGIFECVIQPMTMCVVAYEYVGVQPLPPRL